MVMVVYDVTNKQSFGSCSKWLERVKAKKVTPESPLPGKCSHTFHYHFLNESIPYLLIESSLHYRRCVSGQ